MIIRILLIIIAIILIYAFIILLGSISFNTSNADYLLVLGHALNNDKLTDVCIYRLKGAIKYLNSNPNTKLVLSGGITKNNTKSEAQVMKDYLIDNGIDSNIITLEDKSTDTVENIENSLSYLNSNLKIVVLSSNYHVLRAKMICRLLGLKVKGIGVFTPLSSLVKHILIEEVFIFIHYHRIKNKETI